MVFIIRPSVPCHHIREYRYVYGAVEPLTGESCFVVMPYCNTESMNMFLEELSNTFPRDKIILVCDGAAWHKSGLLRIPENIELVFIPPYTPEMNPIEQIWKEIRKDLMKNVLLCCLIFITENDGAVRHSTQYFLCISLLYSVGETPV